MIRKTLLIALAVAGFLAAAPARAADVDLFVASAPDDAPRAATPASMRDVRVVPAAAAALANGSADVVRIEITPGVVVTAQRIGSGLQDGVATWSGDVVDDAMGGVDVVIRNGRITGQVTRNGMTWRIEPAGAAGVHRVRRVVESRPLRDVVKVPPKASFVPTLPDADGPDAATKSTIRVLVGFTPAAAAAVADIRAEAALAVSLANSAYTRSGTLISLQLAGVKRFALNEATQSFDGILNDATSASGAFAGLPATRNQVRADLVSILTAKTDYCGIAWLGPSRDYAHSVVSVACITYHSFAHELGHNMGLRHDRYVEARAPASQYNFGYVNKVARVRDIMSYESACAAAGVSCTRVPIFSTPLKTWSGAKIGVAPGTKGAAFGAKALNDTRKTVAAFR